MVPPPSISEIAAKKIAAVGRMSLMAEDLKKKIKEDPAVYDPKNVVLEVLDRIEQEALKSN